MPPGATQDEVALGSRVFDGKVASAPCGGCHGTDGTGSPPHWDLSAQPAPGEVDDFAFVRRLIDALSQSLCIDPARVYATGMSDGGFFSSELACQPAPPIGLSSKIRQPMYASTVRWT